MRLDQLTVIVPTRNEAKNIQGFLRSLPDQVALIVVDASEDNTPELVNKYRPNRTSVLCHPGRISEARFYGAQMAQSPWLLFTDADIVFGPDYFERLQHYPRCAVIYGPKLSQGEFIHYYRWFARGQQLSQWLGVPAASGSNLLISRQSLFRSGGFDLQLTCNEDSELVWRVKRAGFSVRFAPDLIVYEQDHRRLRLGRTRKTIHSLTRCLLLYLDLIPNRWRSRDWGYWSHQSKNGDSQSKAFTKG